MANRKQYNEEVNRAIETLEKNGWVFGYLSGHGDSECVFAHVNGKYLVVGDAEKQNIVLEPEGKCKEPWDYYA